MAQVMALTSINPSLAPNDQSSSTLLQLPAEVRLIILRQLLKRDKPIYSLSSTDDLEYLESIQRSAQLLRTCQLLHTEGLAILYTENTLCIDFMGFDDEADEETIHFCGLFEMFLPIPEKLAGSKDELLSLIDYATPDKATTSDDTGLMKQSAESLIKKWDTLQKFARFQVRVQYATQHTIFSACRLLQYLLKGKDVTFTLHMVDEEEEYRIPETEHDKTPAQMLQSCRLLRCTSVLFEIQNFAISPQPQPSGIKHVEDLTALITSAASTYDVYAEWVQTRQQLCALLAGEGLGDIEDTFEVDTKALQQAAMDYDQVEYKHKMHIFLTKLKDDLIEDAQDSIATCDNDEDISELRQELDDKILFIEEHFGRALADQLLSAI